MCQTPAFACAAVFTAMQIALCWCANDISIVGNEQRMAAGHWPDGCTLDAVHHPT